MGAAASLAGDADPGASVVGRAPAAVVGCALAARLPARVLVLGIVLLEGLLAIWIPDNLTLNILMLVHPVDAIRRWQLGG